jgi:hypothetical protein
LFIREGFSQPGNDAYDACGLHATGIEIQLQVAAYAAMTNCAVAQRAYSARAVRRAAAVFADATPLISWRTRWAARVWLAPITRCLRLPVASYSEPLHTFDPQIFISENERAPLYSSETGWRLPVSIVAYSLSDMERGYLGSFEQDGLARQVFRAQALYCFQVQAGSEWSGEARSMIEALPAALHARNLTPRLCEE